MRQLKKALKTAFNIPPAQNKERFLQDINYPKTTFTDFFRTQIGYIRKRVWCLSVSVLIVVMLGGKLLMYYGNGSLLIVSAILPLLALMTATEVYRSMSFGMAELEMSTRYNLSCILMVRMTILMGSNLLLLVIILPFVKKFVSYGYIKTGIYMIVPYLFTCLLTLVIINITKGRNTLWCCIAASSLVSGSYFIMMNQIKLIFEERYYRLWVIALFIIIVITVKQIRMMKKGAEEYIWNLSLTE